MVAGMVATVPRIVHDRTMLHEPLAPVFIPGYSSGALPKGYCRQCGALVVDRVAHFEFHDRVDPLPVDVDDALAPYDPA